MESIKVVLVGSNEVKKSRFLYQYRDILSKKESKSEYPSVWENENGLELFIKISKDEENKSLHFNLYDTSKYSKITLGEVREVRSMTLLGANMIFLCCDFSSQSSFEFISKVYINEIKPLKLPFILLKFGEKKQRFDISLFKNDTELFINDYDVSFSKDYTIMEVFQKLSSYFYHLKYDPPQNSLLTKLSSYIISKPDPKSFIITTHQIPSDFKGYSVNFYSVFTCKEMKKVFEEFLKKESNPQPFAFILDVQSMDININETSITQFKEICKKYIVVGSDDEINISGICRNSILDIYKNIEKEWKNTKTPYESFAQSIKEIIGDLKGDVWPRFLSDPETYKVIEELKENIHVITKDPYQSIKTKASNIGRFLVTGEDFLSRIISNEDEYKKNYFEELTNKKNEEIEKEIFIYQNDEKFILEICELIFEWDEKEICIPKKKKLELQKIQVKNTNLFTFNLDKFVKKVWEWNCFKSYSKISCPKSPIFGNSKDFVSSLLDEMNLKVDFNKK